MKKVRTKEDEFNRLTAAVTQEVQKQLLAPQPNVQTRRSTIQSNKRFTRSSASSSKEPLPKQKKSSAQVQGVEYFENWKQLKVQIPGIADGDLVTHTRNWQTVIQIKLGIISYLYSKIVNDKKDLTAMSSAIKDLESCTEHKQQDIFKKSLGEKLEESVTQKGKNLLVAFALVVLNRKNSNPEYKIIDISSTNQLVHFLDDTGGKVSELCGAESDEDIRENASRDYHTEASACLDIPNIVKKSLRDMGHKDFSMVSKTYIYMDSTKSCCNDCVKKIQRTQTEHNDLPLSFIVNWHKAFSGSMGSEVCKDDTLKNDESDGLEAKKNTAADLISPVRHFKSDEMLLRDTPAATISKTAEKQPDGELEVLALQSRVYISGSIETIANQQIQALFAQHKHSIDSLTQKVVHKFFTPERSKKLDSKGVEDNLISTT